MYIIGYEGMESGNRRIRGSDSESSSYGGGESRWDRSRGRGGSSSSCCSTSSLDALDLVSSKGDSFRRWLSRDVWLPGW